MSSVLGVYGGGNGLERQSAAAAEKNSYQKTAGKLGENLYDLEQQLLAAYAKPEGKGRDAEIAALDIKYKRAMRLFEAFSTMMKNMHEMMMSVIRNMRLN